MLAVENIDVFYGDAQALDGVSLEVEEGAIVAIVGANGAGKSSLIRTIAGIERPRAGTIRFMNYGSGGAGTSNHLAGELFNIVTGAKLVHVLNDRSSYQPGHLPLPAQMDTSANRRNPGPQRPHLQRAP